ncbi:MAG: HPr family phosphocarrier protein [Elusimicrobiales bacterium]|nr:HPr family phosphocarrier protein [Elusimicrobiales bacterium]
MIRRDVIVKNEQGLHARPCRIISQVAMNFQSEIKLIKDGYEVNAKSIMGILSMAASKGSVITIIANGSDEREAVEEIANLFETKFDEE